MMRKWSLYILMISIIPVLAYTSSIFRLHSDDELELCYGNLRFDKRSNVVNIKYIPEYIPYRYNFINSTLTVDEVKNDNVVFTRSSFLKYRYASNLNTGLVVALTGHLKYNDMRCSVNVSCFIKNLMTHTSTILTSKHVTYSLYRSRCIIIIGYDSILWYKDNISDHYNDVYYNGIYDFTAICMLIASTVIVLVYVLKRIKMNY
ncbi:Type I membrane glycoprotein [Orthopoxvirus akhmetapox]|uniref:Type I membrane glycoprotein n=2 Tax=Orthopoxvirus akhmetapox TaxID=2200830 RepID=A0A5J6CR79_9POXV|nr:Type I membrane glycoprotein [Akhmeta virus]